MWRVVVVRDDNARRDSACFEIIAFTIIAQKGKKEMIVKSFVLCSVSPALHQHIQSQSRGRFEILPHAF